jgi:hypothetical protein
MPKYYWSREEESRLLELWKKGITDPHILAKELGRKPLAVERKLQRMAVVVGKRKITQTTTTEVVPKDLLTHEQALKDLAGAVHDLKQRGLDKLELQRLRILVDALQACDSVLSRFMNNRLKLRNLNAQCIWYRHISQLETWLIIV